MATTRKGPSKVFTLRVDHDKLEQLRVIADRERRTLVSKLRVMIDDEVARAHRAANALLAAEAILAQPENYSDLAVQAAKDALAKEQAA